MTNAPDNSAAIKYPADGAFRGYFYVFREDVLRGSHVPTGVWKKVDYLRLKDFALHLLNPSPGKVILDVGCNVGAIMVYCGLQGATVYGQDLDADSVLAANEAMERFGLCGEAQCGDAVQLLFSDNQFDAVISNEFLEHITDDVKVRVLREILRVLKPGGVVVIKSPNLSYLKLSLLYKRMRRLLRFRGPLKIVIPLAPGTNNPQHIGLTTRWRLTRCLAEAGFFNYQFFYAPLRRFGLSSFVEVLSTEIPVLRDCLCEDLFCRAFKPLILSHFPD